MLTGCARNTIIAYEPTAQMNAQDASRVVEEMIMSQHSNWRPQNIVITSEYIVWNYGRITEPIGWGQGVTSREISDRIYFNSMKNVQLMTWQRKFKEWYVVSVIGKDSDSSKHIFYTRSEDEAKRFLDAFESLMLSRKKL